jgi:hypothetical protein
MTRDHGRIVVAARLSSVYVDCALPSAGSAICGACLVAPPPCCTTVAASLYAPDHLVQDLSGTTVAAHWARQALAATVLRSLAASRQNVHTA